MTVAAPPTRSSRAFWVVLINVGIAAWLARGTGAVTWAPIAAWVTVVISLVVQAIPFLVLGVALSATIAAAQPRWLTKVMPARSPFSIPLAGVAGMAIPGCECSSVPVARRLVAQGVPAASALTFLLASPAINPVVLVSTAVAFPGEPKVVLARFVASLTAAVTVGMIWSRRDRSAGLFDSVQPGMHTGSFATRFVSTVQHDFLQAGGFLVVGALVAATIKVSLPRGALDSIGGHGAMSVIALAMLAVVLSLCSEADAFIAASFTQFSMSARLAFLVVGPMVDLKLIAMQTGVFGKRFTARFAPLTFVVALSAAAATAAVLL